MEPSKDKTVAEPPSNPSSFAEERATSTSGATAATAMQREDAGQGNVAGEVQQGIPYRAVGETFTDWFNGKVRQLTNPTISLGTKTATVVGLRPDGRLECSLHGEGGGEAQHFVAFEPQYLDQLSKRIAAIGV
jgi:hypothetical protein